MDPEVAEPPILTKTRETDWHVTLSLCIILLGAFAFQFGGQNQEPLLGPDRLCNLFLKGSIK